MKTITVTVSEPVFEDFEAFAKKKDLETEELIREAMETYRETHMVRRTSLRDRQPASVGGPILPVTRDEDLLGSMLNDARTGCGTVAGGRLYCDSETRSKAVPALLGTIDRNCA